MADLNKILTGLKVARKNEFLPYLEKELKKFSDENIARFLANCLLESGMFNTLRESMYYTTADRLKAIYPSVFVKLGYNPNNYLKNTQKLANLVYDTRIAPNAKYLGNTQDGYGFAYRGGGLIQITGRYNYLKMSQDTKVDFIKKPELIEQPEYAVKSAIWFWNSNKLSDKSTPEQTRKAVKGSITKDDYNQFYNLYLKVKSFM